MKVDFLIGGAQKGGTTALAKLLRRHPEICMPSTKELHFFDDGRLYAGGTPDYGIYHAQFEPAAESRICGEATPIYMYWEPVARRVRDYNPAMKWIFILRNPIDRAWSHWRMTTRRGEETLDFSTAIRTEAVRCEGRQHRYFSYVGRGRYAEQLSRLRTLFPAGQMLVFRNEDLLADSRAVMSRSARFLGLGDCEAEPPDDERSGGAGPAAEDRAYLAEQYSEDLTALERLLGWDCSGWRA